MLVSADKCMYVGICAVLCRIADEDAVTQGIYALRQIHRVALCLHGSQCVKHRFKNRQVSRTANIACIGREIEDNNRHFAHRAFRASERYQFTDSGGQHQSALWAGMHVLCSIGRFESAGMVATCAGHAGRARTAAKQYRAGAAIELRDSHHDGALHGQ